MFLIGLALLPAIALSLDADWVFVFFFLFVIVVDIWAYKFVKKQSREDRELAA